MSLHRERAGASYEESKRKIIDAIAKNSGDKDALFRRLSGSTTGGRSSLDLDPQGARSKVLNYGDPISILAKLSYLSTYPDSAFDTATWGLDYDPDATLSSYTLDVTNQSLAHLTSFLEGAVQTDPDFSNMPEDFPRRFPTLTSSLRSVCTALQDRSLKALSP